MYGPVNEPLDGPVNEPVNRWVEGLIDGPVKEPVEENILDMSSCNCSPGPVASEITTSYAFWGGESSCA